jgi:hypothetical protein
MLKTNPYRKAAKKATIPSKTNEKVFDEAGKYNPRPIGRMRGDGKIVAAKSGRMFDKSGQVNAYDNKDLLQQVAYLLQNVTKENPVPKEAMRKESALSKSAKQRAIVAAFKDPTGEGFHMIGQELLAPIKELIDYEGWARKCLRVRPLAQGEIFRLTKDVAYQTVSWVIGQDGMTPESRVIGRYVVGPEFKVTAFVDIDIAEIYQMQFDGLDRAQDLARQDIERKEDQAFITALDKASTTYNSITYFSSLSVSAFEDVRFQVERNRLVVDKFLINRQELSDVVKTMSGAVDPATQRELILSGYIGNILNTQIVTSAGTGTFEVVPAGKIYAVPAAEYLGDMGIRIDLFSEPYNRYAVGETVKGWALIEQIGYILPNARAAAKGSK